MDLWIKAIVNSNIKKHLKEEILAALQEHARCEPSKKPAYVKDEDMPGKDPQ